MLIIKSPTNDPYFNIAAEEYILEDFTQDVFLLYINSPSIIVGRYQNTISQLNPEYIRQNDIKVVRRLTGGGAVFHDQGNLNFSFICHKSSDDDHSFERYTEPIINYLHTLGIKAELKGRNDLIIDGKKFSGNARLTTATKILQHGTLLFSASMSDLTQALKSDPLKFKDKSVKSIQSRVTNISEHLPESLSVQEFEIKLVEYIISSYPEAQPYSLNSIDIGRINYKSNDKYSTWNWNFGNSPKYDYDKTVRTKGGILEVRLIVSDGIIKQMVLNGDFFTRQPIEPLLIAFRNCRHHPHDVHDILAKFKVEDYLINVTGDDLFCALF